MNEHVEIIEVGGGRMENADQTHKSAIDIIRVVDRACSKVIVGFDTEQYTRNMVSTGRGF